MSKAKLYGVGVGPGDPELLTAKAIRVIRECAVVAVPQLSLIHICVEFPGLFTECGQILLPRLRMNLVH